MNSCASRISELPNTLLTLLARTKSASGNVTPPIFELLLFFKYLLVGVWDMLWAGDHGSVDLGSAMYVCHTNQIGSTIKHQSNFLL